MHASSEIRTHDLSVFVGEYISCLRDRALPVIGQHSEMLTVQPNLLVMGGMVDDVIE
jgi:hypothetical protein